MIGQLYPYFTHPPRGKTFSCGSLAHLYKHLLKTIILDTGNFVGDTKKHSEKTDSSRHLSYSEPSQSLFLPSAARRWCLRHGN